MPGLMVEIFKTNVDEKEQAQRLLVLLKDYFPFLKMNFDLEDCDRILRIEGEEVLSEKIIEVVTANGFQCFFVE